MDPLELALGFAAFASITDNIEEQARSQERKEALRDDLYFAGLDETELYFMDGDKRAEALEGAGLNPYDYDDFDW